MAKMIFELFKNGKSVGFEEHKLTSYYNDDHIRIYHSKYKGINVWDIKEWPERYIEHDEKKLL